MFVNMCVCVCVCGVRACVRTYVHACVRAYVRACVRVYILSANYIIVAFDLFPNFRRHTCDI